MLPFKSPLSHLLLAGYALAAGGCSPALGPRVSSPAPPPCGPQGPATLRSVPSLCSFLVGLEMDTLLRSVQASTQGWFCLGVWALRACWPLCSQMPLGARAEKGAFYSSGVSNYDVPPNLKDSPSVWQVVQHELRAAGRWEWGLVPETRSLSGWPRAVRASGQTSHVEASAAVPGSRQSGLPTGSGSSPDARGPHKS